MADEVVGGAVIKVGIDSSDLASQGAKAAAAVGAALSQAEKAQAKVTKQIQGNIDRINATRATDSMRLLEQAVAQMGGKAKLNADQVSRLTKEIERLSAAGAKVPKTLQLPAVPGAGGIGQAATNALSGLGPGGAIGAGLSALGPAGIAVGALSAGVLALTKSFIDASDQLADLSNKTGISIATLDAWGEAAKTSGVSAETLAESALKLSANIAQGDTSFERLGLKLEELRKMTPEQQFETVSQRILELGTDGEQAAAALETMGKSGAEALQALRDGFLGNLPAAKEHAAAMEESRIEAAKMADDMDEVAKSFDRAKNAVAGFVVGGLAPILRNMRTHGLGALSPTMLAFGGGEQLPDFGDVKSGVNTGPPPAAPTFKSAAELAKEEAAAKKAASEREAAERKAEAARKKAADERYREMQLETVAARELEKARQAEIDLLVSKGVAAEERRLFLMQSQVEMAQAEADARARVAGTAESKADSRQQIIEARDAIQHEAAKRKEMIALVDQLAGKDTVLAQNLKDRLGLSEQVVQKTRDWNQELANAAHLMAAMPGLLGKVGGALVSIQGGISSIVASFKNMGGGKGILSSLKGGGAASLLGKAGNILGGIGAIGSMASAAFGIGKAIVGLFKSDPVKKAQKEAGKILGTEVSREMAEQIIQESKATGKSVSEVAKKMLADQKREAAIAKRQALEEGLSTFQGGLEQAVDALKDVQKSPALQAALDSIGASLDAALGKAGMFRTPEALKQSAGFTAAQTAAGGLAQAAAGARQAGVLDTGLSAALATASKELQAQAAAEAKAAGLSDAESQRAGFGAVAGLLREQLNAQLQANGRVDEALQAQLDEAKANGIEILADPAIEQLDVAKKQLEVMEKGFGVVASAASGKAAGAPGGLSTGASVAAPPGTLDRSGFDGQIQTAVTEALRVGGGTGELGTKLDDLAKAIGRPNVILNDNTNVSLENPDVATMERAAEYTFSLLEKRSARAMDALRQANRALGPNP